MRYTYRLRPGAEAERALLDGWNRCRAVWNRCVSLDRVMRAEGQRSLTGYGMSGELTKWRAEFDWMREGSQNAQQNTVITWGRARRASFIAKGRGEPRFKSRHKARPSLEYTVNGFTIGDRLLVAKCPPMPVVWHRELPSTPTGVRVYRDAEGHWWASFVVTRDAEVVGDAAGAVGFDWGVTVTATASDPTYDLVHAQHGRSAAGELAKYQRRMARRAPAKGQRGSNGYRKAKRDAAKVHGRVDRRRQHDAIQWARKVVADNELIAVEDFKPKFLARSTMARKAADARIGTAKRVLLEYGTRAGRTVVLVPAAYTTMTCSHCASRAKTRLRLDERIFRCAECGFTADRDRNAARTILASAELIRVGVESVRHDLPSGSCAA